MILHMHKNTHGGGEGKQAPIFTYGKILPYTYPDSFYLYTKKYKKI